MFNISQKTVRHVYRGAPRMKVLDTQSQYFRYLYWGTSRQTTEILFLQPCFILYTMKGIVETKYCSMSQGNSLRDPRSVRVAVRTANQLYLAAVLKGGCGNDWFQVQHWVVK